MEYSAFMEINIGCAMKVQKVLGPGFLKSMCLPSKIL